MAVFARNTCFSTVLASFALVLFCFNVPMSQCPNVPMSQCPHRQPSPRSLGWSPPNPNVPMSQCPNVPTAQWPASQRGGGGTKLRNFLRKVSSLSVEGSKSSNLLRASKNKVPILEDFIVISQKKRRSRSGAGPEPHRDLGRSTLRSAPGRGGLAFSAPPFRHAILPLLPCPLHAKCANALCLIEF